MPMWFNQISAKFAFFSGHKVREFHLQRIITIVPFISRDFYATIADSFNIEQSDAIGLATNLTDDTYINYIQEKVFDEIYDDLAYSGTEYLNDTITYVGSEDLYPVDAQKKQS